MKPICLLAWIILCSSQYALSQQNREVNSPNATIRLLVNYDSPINYSVFYNGTLLISPSHIDMQLHTGQSISKTRVRKVSARTVNNTIVSPVPEKRKNIPDRYNELRVDLASPFYILFRVYDDGVAYRIGTTL